MRTYFYSIICMLLIACNNANTDPAVEAARREFLPEKNPVDIMVLERTTFYRELVSNGKLRAAGKSVLKFDTGEELAELFVKNGDRITAGQPIAKLRQDRQLRQLEQAGIRMEQAALSLQEYLIGQGYNPADTSGVPEDRLEIGRIRSGYNAAKSEYELALLVYEGTELKAPFSGVIANLSYKIHERVTAGTEFCSLIDNTRFDVEFPVLESELKDIAIGKAVKVIPFATGDTLFNGVIKEINPLVDENGMIKVTASLRQTGNLMDGMNVQVLVETAVAGQLVVPKQAVVLRDNQEVLFKKVNGLAYWTYVQTGLENSTSYTVIAHPEKGATLEPGDSVIISGNLNLAHESEVVEE